MRTLFCLGTIAALCLLAQPALAQNYRDTSGDTINPEKAINNSPYNAHIQLGQENYAPRSYRARSYAPAPVNRNQAAAANAQTGQQNRGEQWRYRRYNGQWWYYMPNKQWMVWNGSRWNEHMAQAGTTQGQNQNASHQ